MRAFDRVAREVEAGARAAVEANACARGEVTRG